MLMKRKEIPYCFIDIKVFLDGIEQERLKNWSLRFYVLFATIKHFFLFLVHRCNEAIEFVQRKEFVAHTHAQYTAIYSLSA